MARIIEVRESAYVNSWTVYYDLGIGVTHPGRLYINKRDACDELAAYMQAMRILERQDDV